MSVEDDMVPVAKPAVGKTLPTDSGVLWTSFMLQECVCLQAAQKGCAAGVPMSRANQVL